jgi:NADH-quinone oxidoreductase subunit E/NADP-reducing hydrogenase subunit HndA
MTKPQAVSVTKPISQELPKEKLAELEAYLDNLETTKGALVQVLHKAQTIFGYLPRDLQLYIARKLGIPGAEVFGVISFYSYFTTKPGGKHTISVCMGTACFVRGADKVIEGFKETMGVKANETTTDGQFTLKDVRCIGACGLAPVVTVDDRVHGRVNIEQIEKILNSYGMEAGTIVTGKMVTALKRMGFDAVFDTNFGADLTVIEEASELIYRGLNYFRHRRRGDRSGPPHSLRMDDSMKKTGEKNKEIS